MTATTRPQTIMGATLELLRSNPTGQRTDGDDPEIVAAQRPCSLAKVVAVLVPWTACRLAEEVGRAMGREVTSDQVRRAIGSLRRRRCPITITQQLSPTRLPPVYELDVTVNAWQQMATAPHPRPLSTRWRGENGKGDGNGSGRQRQRRQAR